MATITANSTYIEITELGIYINKSLITDVIKSVVDNTLSIVTNDNYVTILSLGDLEYTTLDEMLEALSEPLADNSGIIFSSSITDYNKTTSSSGGTSNYNDLSNTPDLSVYELTSLKDADGGYMGLDSEGFPDPVKIIESWKNFSITTHTGGASFDIDFNNGCLHKILLDQDSNLNNPTIPDGTSGTFAIIVEQDSVGTRDLTYSNAWRFPGDVSPIISLQEANKVNILTGIIDSGVVFVTSIENFSRI